MCTKCLKEELLFCAPIPPPKKKGKLKKKKTEGEIVPIDQVLISNEQVEETQNAIEPAPMVLVNGDLITVTPLSSPPPQVTHHDSSCRSSQH
ncbi:hypothetical protein EON65_34810 [archaeon]|nr:MAG: hypothetical protein EON65_34810 [archaeon]